MADTNSDILTNQERDGKGMSMEKEPDVPDSDDESIASLKSKLGNILQQKKTPETNEVTGTPKDKPASKPARRIVRKHTRGTIISASSSPSSDSDIDTTQAPHAQAHPAAHSLDSSSTNVEDKSSAKENNVVNDSKFGKSNDLVSQALIDDKGGGTKLNGPITEEDDTVECLADERPPSDEEVVDLDEISDDMMAGSTVEEVGVINSFDSDHIELNSTDSEAELPQNDHKGNAIQ